MVFARLEPRRDSVKRLLIAGILAATCVRVWVGPSEVLPRAAAQIPDSGLQRKRIVEEIERTNGLLEQILRTLQTETFKVSMESADNPKGVVPVPRSAKP